MEVTLEEAFHGKSSEIEIEVSQACDSCNGSGATPGTSTRGCKLCGGYGKVRAKQGFFVVERPCHNCHGRGEVLESIAGRVWSTRDDALNHAVHALGPVLAEFAPTVLVMDIEGGEYALLNLPEWTAGRSLRAIVVEIHRPPTEDALRGLACLQTPWKLDRTVDQLAAEIRSGGNRTVTLLRD